MKNKSQTSFAIIHSVFFVFLLISTVCVYVLFQDNEKERKIKEIIQQVQSYDSAIHLFEERFGEHPAKLKNAKNLWPESQEIPDDLPEGIVRA
jgi:hypothetical protein